MVINQIRDPAKWVSYVLRWCGAMRKRKPLLSKSVFSYSPKEKTTKGDTSPLLLF